MRNVREYAVVTGTYWMFTLTDGALRMLVLLHLHELGYSPLEIASLFLLYELFGVITNPKLQTITDLEWREIAIFAPLIVATLYMGVQPNIVFNLTQASVDQLVQVYQAAIGR